MPKVYPSQTPLVCADLPTADIHGWGTEDYATIWSAMQTFTRARDTHSPDAIWHGEHFPIYTAGPRARPEHLLPSRDHRISCVHTDRGGEWTYHGPGQWICYILWNLPRAQLPVTTLVHKLETVLIHRLQTWGIAAHARPGAPGVYTAKGKIASLGLRVKNGCSYHGLAFNVDMDLTPFQGIYPCGQSHTPATDLRRCGVHMTISEVSDKLIPEILAVFM